MKTRLILLMMLWVFALTISPRSVVSQKKQNQSGVTAVDQTRIKKGMTVKEVECVFGVKGGDFPFAGVRTLSWPGDDGSLVAIYFDRQFRAERVFVYGPEETWWQKLRRLIKRR